MDLKQLTWHQYRRQFNLIGRSIQCAVVGALYDNVDVTDKVDWIEQTSSDEFAVRCNNLIDVTHGVGLEALHSDKSLSVTYIGFDPDTKTAFCNTASFDPDTCDVTSDGRFIFGVSRFVFTQMLSYNFVQALYKDWSSVK